MTRVFVVLAAGVLSAALAQSGAVLETFVPAPLPKTIKPTPIPKTMSDFPSNVSIGGSCLPSVKNLQVPSDVSKAIPDAKVSKQIQQIVDADQAARQGTLAANFETEDLKRRTALLPLIPRAVTSQDFANIALVFQHGGCVPQFMLANRMTVMSMKTNKGAKQSPRDIDPKSLYAATLDRALMYSGRAQKFGTQYFGGCSRLYVVDPRTTDAERKNYNVPPLKEAIALSKKFATPGCKP
jgi:hypothetical protein